MDKLHGSCTAFGINISMTTYLLPKARNVNSGQTVKQQDLSGNRFTQDQRAFAQEMADRLAVDMSGRTGEQWVGLVEEYTPTERNPQKRIKVGRITSAF